MPNHACAVYCRDRALSPYCFSHMCLVSYDHLSLPDLTVSSLAQYRPGQTLKSLLQSPVIALVGGNTCVTYSADHSVSNKFLYAASGFDKPTKEIDWEEIESQRCVAMVIWECATFYRRDQKSGKFVFNTRIPAEGTIIVFPKLIRENIIPQLLQNAANGMTRVAKSNTIVTLCKTVTTYREFDLSLMRTGH